MLFNPHKFGLHKLLQYIPLHKVLDAPFQKQVQTAVTIADLRQIAKRRAHKMIFDYVDGGADDERTLRRNKDAYSDYDFFRYPTERHPRPPPPPVDLSTTLFGKRVKLPFFGCPTAGNKMFHFLGEQAAAHAAVHHGSLYTMSSLSTTSIPDIAQIVGGGPEKDQPKLFQHLVWKDRAVLKDSLELLKEYQFDAIALTAEVTWLGNRERDLRNGFSVPPDYSNFRQMVDALKRPAWTFDFLSHEPYGYACVDTEKDDNTVPMAESLVSFINRQLTPEFDWKDAEWLLGEWNGPAALKGVVRPEDAKRGMELGFSTIWISNHGGRQLDTSPATVDVLPAIREAVGPDMEIVLCGGIQRGTDIAKAIALGANGVGVGRSYIWGLAAGGTAGVIKVYDILKTELDRAMSLLGVSSIEQLRSEGSSLVKKRIGGGGRGYGGGLI